MKKIQPSKLTLKNKYAGRIWFHSKGKNLKWHKLLYIKNDEDKPMAVSYCMRFCPKGGSAELTLRPPEDSLCRVCLVIPTDGA